MDKFICVGKNYLEHEKELGDAKTDSPVFFLKPPSAGLWVSNSNDLVEVQLPKDRGPVHYECEVIALLDQNGRIKAISLGLDMTLRELQGQLKKKGHPWEASKVFHNSAVVGPWILISEFSNYLDVEFSFQVNGVVRQKAQAREMRVLPEECVHQARKYFPICEGDILFTGTPAGVGPVAPGQNAELRWGDRLRYQVRFA